MITKETANYGIAIRTISENNQLIQSGYEGELIDLRRENRKMALRFIRSLSHQRRVVYKPLIEYMLDEVKSTSSRNVGGLAA